MPEELHSRHLIERLIGFAVLVVIVVVLIHSLPGFGTIRARFSRADPWLLALIALLKLCSCLSNIVAFRDVFCPRMGWRFSYRLGMAEQATNVLLPTGGAGGLALGAWALRQGGMPTEHIARRSVCFFVLTSIPNFAFAALLGPLLLAGVFSGKVPTVPTAIFAALAWVVALITVLLPRLLTRLAPAKEDRSFAGRLRSGAATLGRGIEDTGQLIRAGRWPAILGALGYLSFDIAAMIVGFATVGPIPPVAPLVFAYVIGQLGGLIPLPGGIGGTDGGLIGATILYGASLSQAAAAVIAYRAFQLGIPALLGTIAFFQLRRELSRSSAPASACAPLAEAPVEVAKHSS